MLLGLRSDADAISGFYTPPGWMTRSLYSDGSALLCARRSAGRNYL